MASRQFGKLRQWAGEVISSREKTVYSDDFQELEKVIDQRKNGADRISNFAEAYCRNLSKKKDCGEDSEKMLPIDALGVSMIVHGEEIGDESDFGRSLVLFGRAHCKAAALQEGLATNIKEFFIETLESFNHDVKEYEAQRRKLDSRRLAYDAALSKMEKFKGNKKEKERFEVEEDLERAKFRFEETSEDVRALMAQVQDHEAHLMKALTNLLNLELTYAQKYLGALEETNAGWPDQSLANPTAVQMHWRSSSVSLSKKKSPSSSRFGSKTMLDRESPSPADVDTDSEEEKQPPPLRSRRSSAASRKRTKSDASTISRSRPGSSVGNNKEGHASKFSVSGVAGWASNAVGGVMGGTRKDRDSFANLNEDPKKHLHGSDEEDETSKSIPSRSGIRSGLSRRLSSRAKSREKTPSPKVAPKIIKKPSEPRIVKTLYDFNGSADELGFKAGDEIRVINEVLDDWWLGEIVGGNGKQGLFPTSFVHQYPTAPNESETEDEIYGQQPMSATSGLYLGTSDTASVNSIDESQGLMKQDESVENGESRRKKLLGVLDPTNLRRPIPRRTLSDASSSTTTSSLNGSGGPSIGKKPPPPPPPRRQSTNSGTPPSLPARKRGFTTGSQSSATSLSSVDVVKYDTSPFESAADLMSGKDEGGCRQFKQNPFKPKGLCSNCWEYHEEMVYG